MLRVRFEAKSTPQHFSSRAAVCVRIRGVQASELTRGPASHRISEPLQTSQSSRQGSRGIVGEMVICFSPKLNRGGEIVKWNIPILK